MPRRPLKRKREEEVEDQDQDQDQEMDADTPRIVQWLDDEDDTLHGTSLGNKLEQKVLNEVRFFFVLNNMLETFLNFRNRWKLVRIQTHYY